VQAKPARHDGAAGGERLLRLGAHRDLLDPESGGVGACDQLGGDGEAEADRRRLLGERRLEDRLVERAAV
jgi:hypothetical protein